MTHRELNELIQTSKKKIMDILIDMECRGGCHVKSVALKNIDVTNIEDSKRRFIRGIVLNLSIDGSDWGA